MNIKRKPVNIVVGRFQTLTLGHLEMSKELLKENGLPTIYVYIRSKSGKNAHLSDNLTQKMMDEVVKKYSHIEHSISFDNAYLPAIVNELHRIGYEPILVGAGPDRFEDYQKMVQKAKMETDENFAIYPFRNRFFGVSATKVREFIIKDDFNNFKKNTPACLHSFYKEFRDELMLSESLEIDLDEFFGISEHKIEEKVIISQKIFKKHYTDLSKMLKTEDDKIKLHDLIKTFFEERGFNIENI